MLIERSQAIIGTVAAVIVGTGATFGVLATEGMFEPGDVISAEFSDAAGIEEGAFVLVGGHRAGRVMDVQLEGTVASVEFTLTAPEIPADSSVDIIIENTLGRRALTVTPGTSSTVLTDGDEIPMERTGTPVDLPELGDRSEELLGEVDVESLQDLTTALADITDGAHDDVDALLTGVEDVTHIVSERREEISDVLEHAETVVDAAATKDQQIVAIIDDFGSVLNRLVDRRDDISRLLRETAGSSTTTADLVEERREQIDHVLAELHRDLEVVDDHQVDLAHTFATLSAGLEGFAGIGYQAGEAKVDNPEWGNVFTTGLGAAGIGALLECNGALDQLLTDLMGPDPRCEQDPDENPTPGDGPPREDEGDDASPLPDPGDLLSPPSTSESLSSFLSPRGGER